MPRDLEWEACRNARDLGGLPTGDGRATAFGAVVRSDDRGRLTERGWQAARDYGIRTILDLRSDPECAEDPRVDPAFAVGRFSLFDHFDTDPEYDADLGRRLAGLGICEQYRLVYLEALERDAARFAEALAFLAAAPPGGVLVHCFGGKDRTGVLAALLLRLVGVPLDVVDADYTRSEERLGLADSAPAEVIVPVIEELERRHGSVAGYFRDVGASDEDVRRVAARLLGA